MESTPRHEFDVRHNGLLDWDGIREDKRPAFTFRVPIR